MKTNIDQTYQYMIMDPTGNITALVESCVEISRQPFIAGKIMEKHPEVEQVGFVDLSGSLEDSVQARLRMAGGEFCGNASMCTAVLYAERNVPSHADELEICLAVSGADEPVAVKLKKPADGVTEAGVKMPRAHQVQTQTLRFQNIEAEIPLVSMQGISHLIIEESSPFSFLKQDHAAAEEAVRNWCSALSAGGLGLMFLSGKAPELNLVPLVYIPESGTVFWENSCGSGSSACGMYLAEKEKKDVSLTIHQPGGVLHVESRFGGDTVMSGTVKILASCFL